MYDTYRGVVTYVRVVDGLLSKRERSMMMSTGATHETLEVGVISPEPQPSGGLGAGEVGYLITGVKDVRQARVGDTVTAAVHGASEPAAGYDHPRAMVFSGLYPVDGDDYPELREALDQLRLNDAALIYEPETSTALGFGFRCGFLGLLHMEIVRERLEREFDLELISTAPNVVYRIVMESGAELIVTNPSDFPAEAVPAPSCRATRRARTARPSAGRLPRCTSRSSGPRSSHRATTSGRSWICARAGAASSAAWSTCRPTGWRSGTRCRWPRSSSTSSTSSSRGPAVRVARLRAGR